MGSSQQQQQIHKITFQRDPRGLCAWTLNFIWILLAGWHLFSTWAVVGLVLCVTIIGFPCGFQTLKISWFLLCPFGKSLVYTHDQLGLETGASCCLQSCNCLWNILWAVTVGWMLALQAFLTGILLMLTIVGIPFGWQCFKLTYLCFCPFGIDFIAQAEEEAVYVLPTSTTTTISHYNRAQAAPPAPPPTSSYQAPIAVATPVPVAAPPYHSNVY